MSNSSHFIHLQDAIACLRRKSQCLARKLRHIGSMKPLQQAIVSL
ncbi:hypothetical protein [Calothrix sp. NIES-2098]